MKLLRYFNVVISSVILSFSRYFDFKSRSSRVEFFVFTGFIFLIQMIAIKIDAGILGISFIENFLNQDKGPAINLTIIATIIPTIAISVRRLHDIGKSGWFMLLIFTIIGIIPLIYWHCKQGSLEVNKYGDKANQPKVS